MITLSGNRHHCCHHHCYLVDLVCDYYFLTHQLLFSTVRPHRPYYVRRCGLLLPTEKRGHSLSVSLSHWWALQKRLNRSRCRLGWGLWYGGPSEPCIRWDPDRPMGRGNFERKKGVPLQSIGTLCGHLCKNGWTDRDVIWVMSLSRPKESCVKWGSCSPMGKGILGKGHP